MIFNPTHTERLTMDYISVAEWNKFQHYKHRNPPWVKLYSWFLDDDEFDCMPDASKLLFFCLLSFASRKNNKIKLNFRWLQKKLPIDEPITMDTLQPLMDAGFIEQYTDASKPLAEREQDAIPDKEIKTEREKEQSKQNFSFTAIQPDFFKKLFAETFKPVNTFELNTLNKLAGRCYNAQSQLGNPNYHRYIIDEIADLRLACREQKKGREDFIKMFTSKIRKELNREGVE